MNAEVPLSEARAQLSELVSRVRFGGEQIVLTRHGRGVAALVPIEQLVAHQPDKASASESPADLRVLDLDSRTFAPGGPTEIAAQGPAGPG